MLLEQEGVLSLFIGAARQPDEPNVLLDYVLAIEAQAVNDYDRLRAIEAAARAHIAWQYRQRGAPRFTLSDLRAALTPEADAPSERTELEETP